MPTLAQLPTDNLYKFIAIAGLALIFFGIYLFVSHLVKVEAKVMRLRHAMAAAGARLAALERDAPDPKAQITAQEAAAFSERVLMVRLLQEKNVVNADVLKQLNERLRLLWAIAKILLGIGSVLTVVGFTLWYVQTQRFQDALLQARVHQEMTAKAPATTR